MNHDDYLSNLLAREEIKNRIHLYAHAVDRRQWDLFDHVFHDDAIWQMSNYGGAWRTALRQLIKIFELSVVMSFHQVSNVMATIAGDRADVETYCVGIHRVRADSPPGGLFDGTGEEYDLIAAVRYVDVFAKRDNQWKISSRIGISEWRHYGATSEGEAMMSVTQRGLHGNEDLSALAVSGFKRSEPQS